MFSMPIKVNFDRVECCWEEEEEEEEEELCCGRAGGGRAGSPFKEGSFVGFLSWVSGSSHFFSFSFSFLSFFLGVSPWVLGLMITWTTGKK